MEGWITTWLGMPNTTIVEAQIIGSSEFTKEIDHIIKDFSRYW